MFLERVPKTSNKFEKMTSDSRFVASALQPDTKPDMTKHTRPATLKFTFLSLLLTVLCSISFAQDIPADPAAISAGESLFNANCKTCHRVHQKLIGPALADVYNRAPSIDWIKSFIKNSAGVIASGDAYAVNLYNEYNKTQMTAFSGFKDEQIMQILAYVQAETIKGTPVAAGTSSQMQLVVEMQVQVFLLLI